MNELTKNNGIIYCILEDTHISETVKIVTNAFTDNEYLCGKNGLNISKEIFSRFVYSCCEKANNENISFVAIDEKTNSIVGAIINEDPLTEEIQTENLGFEFDVIFDILNNHLGKLYSKQKSTWNVNDCLHIFMVAIDKEYNGKGIGNTLFSLSCDIARKNKNKYIMVEATGPVSSYFCEKKDFINKGAVIYKDYTYNGEHILNKIEGARGISLYLKELNI